MNEPGQYQDDNACSGQNNCDINIVVEGLRGTRVAANNPAGEFYKEEAPVDESLQEEISLFETGEKLKLTDIDCPYAFDSDSEGIRMENVRAVGAEMLRSDSVVISLCFLLLNDVKQAFTLCKEIEAKKFIKLAEKQKYRAPGEKLLLAIMNTARKNKLERFDLKLVCALHLLERYLAIEKLVPGMNRNSARNKFRYRENTYLPIDRVNLYEICENLNDRDTAILLDKLRSKFGVSLTNTLLPLSNLQPDGTLAGKHLETNLLELYHRRLLDAEVAEISIKKILPPNVLQALESTITRNNGNLSAGTRGILKCRRGKVLIINQREFAPRGQPRVCSIGGRNTYADADSFETREGTNVDEEALRRTWEYYCGPGNVTSVENLTARGMRDACTNFRAELETADSDDIDYMVLCILSHGRLNTETNKDEIMDINWQGVPTMELIDMFALGTYCQSMVGKPKIFIIQACRGRDENFVVENQLASRSHKVYEDDLQEDAPLAAPKKSWFFILNSTIQGFSSWRDRTKGSFFIQSLCQELKENGSRKDIMEIGRETIIRVQDEFRVQAPVMEYSLGSKMYLTQFQSSLK